MKIGRDVLLVNPAVSGKSDDAKEHHQTKNDSKHGQRGNGNRTLQPLTQLEICWFFCQLISVVVLIGNENAHGRRHIDFAKDDQFLDFAVQ